MKMRPKDIGTRYETACANYLVDNGWPYAERRALMGAGDQGDLTGTPGVAWSCKAGQAAYKASDTLIARWMSELDAMRTRSRSDIGVLLLDRSGIGPKRVGETWALVPASTFTRLAIAGQRPVRMHFAALALVLRANGYGEPLTSDELMRAPYRGGVVSRIVVPPSSELPGVASGAS
jgi:hypothetical protein